MLPKGKKICGISWISKNESLGINKSTTLEDMKELLLLPDIVFVDFDYIFKSKELELLGVFQQINLKIYWLVILFMMTIHIENAYRHKK